MRALVTSAIVSVVEVKRHSVVVWVEGSRCLQRNSTNVLIRNFHRSAESGSGIGMNDSTCRSLVEQVINFNVIDGG